MNTSETCVTKGISELNSALSFGLHQLNIALPKSDLIKIIEYIELLRKWNRIHNLTSISNPKHILIKHIFDSLAVRRYIIGPKILDFGSGPGLPGIPLAIALPECQFVLLDSAGKKTIFLNHVRFSLGLKNVLIVNKRVEKFRPDYKFDTVITRATTTIDSIFKITQNLLSKGSNLLIMKGKYPHEEFKEFKKCFEIERIMVPYLNEDRHLVKIPI